MIQRVTRRGAMRRRVVRTVGLCLIAVTLLGLSACDVGSVVLEGTLTHPDTGAPLADVPVRVYTSTEETLVARGRTGEDGVYRFREGSLPAGTYRVVFSGDHWWESGTSWDTATDVAVSAAEPARLDAALVPTTATLWGETLYHDGGPLDGIPVEVFHADTGELVATTVSQNWSPGDPDPEHPCLGWSAGCYELELPAGDAYTVRIPDSVTWGTAADGGFEIELPLGGRQVDLSMPHDAGLAGRVVDGDGAPIVGARVLAIPSDSPVPPLPLEATTGADGRFALQVYPHLSHRLLVVGPDGTLTLGDTEFAVEILEVIDVGDIVLSSP